METQPRKRPGRPRGLPKTGGRKRGTPNKLTVSLKDAVRRAFEKVGGEDYLVTVARNDPRTFCSLLGRLLPSEINAGLGVGLSHEEALAELEARLPPSWLGRASRSVVP